MAIDTVMQEPPTDAVAEPHKPVRKVTVIWLHRNKLPEPRAIWQHLIDEDLVKDLVYTTEINIPPIATRADVRDQIRAKFRMDEIGAQILGLFTSDVININRSEWCEVQRELDEDEGLYFRMTMRKAIDGEDIWELDHTKDNCEASECYEPNEVAVEAGVGREEVDGAASIEVVLPIC